MLDCAASGASIQAVNTVKLQLALLARSEGDPWRLDMETLKAAITNQTLASMSLKLLPTHDVMTQAAAGRWVSGNPLSTIPTVSLGQSALFAELPEGVHSFFLVDENERIDIAVDSKGWTVIHPVNGGGSSGNW